MKKLFFYITICLSTFVCAQQSANIKGSQQLIWKGAAAVGGYSPEGTLNVSSAELAYTSDVITTLEIHVNMKSLQQENKQLEGHLREKDFFHVRKYPTATFVLQTPAKIINNKVELIGTMTIKKKSLREVIHATIEYTSKGIVLQIDHEIDRTLYGITYNSPSVFEKIKENAIADEFQLKGKLRFDNY